MDQLTLPFPQTDVPTVESASWNASVCHRIVLADHRVVYLHYGVSSFQRAYAPFTLETVSVHGLAGEMRERYDLAPMEGQPDPLPRWLLVLIQNTPEPRIVAVN